MNGGFEVDPGVLDSIASTLRNASADVDALGSSVPATPDAGLGRAAIAGILAHLTDNAGQFVIGAGAAGDEIADVAREYQELDAQAREDLHNASGGG